MSVTSSKPSTAVPSKPAGTSQAVTETHENVVKGTVLSLGAIIVGIVLWVVLWRMGFIASIVAFAVVWVAAKLYGIGAGTSDLSRKSAYIIAIVSVVGVILAFVAGMASDLADAGAKEMDMSQLELMTHGEYWSVLGDVLTDGEAWSAYRNDLLMSLLFAGLGMFWTLKDMFITTRSGQSE